MRVRDCKRCKYYSRRKSHWHVLYGGQELYTTKKYPHAWCDLHKEQCLHVKGCTDFKEVNMGGKYEIYARYNNSRLDAYGLVDSFHDYTNDVDKFKQWYDYCVNKYEFIEIRIRK